MMTLITHCIPLHRKMENILVGNTKDIYKNDTSFSHNGDSLCHKLTRQHVYLTPCSKVRVHVAAQVCMQFKHVSHACKTDVAMCRHNRAGMLCIASLQVMSSTVADALTYEDNKVTTETQATSLQMNSLNGRNVLEGTMKRKPTRLPYYHHFIDKRFKVVLK